jgi:hypothetical protein
MTPTRRAIWALAAAVAAGGCTSPLPVKDPMATLKNPAEGPRRLLGAMDALDGQPDEQKAYVEVLLGITWQAGYVQDTRREALARLEKIAPDQLQVTLRRKIPNMGARSWQEELFTIIADRGWTDLAPAVVSAWARPIAWVDDLDRAEYRCLLRMYGDESAVLDQVFNLLVTSDSPGLRTRCWNLLYRLGHRDRLVALLTADTTDTQDVMLLDLRAAARDLDVVPRNQEEILWIHRLREPERAAFWAQAKAVVQSLPEDRRRDLELRDLPIVVAAAIHDPSLLHAGTEEIYGQVEAYVANQHLHVDPGRFEGFPGTYAQRLQQHRDELVWGDVAAMLLAIRAMQVPEVVAHVFDYADRDRLEKSCEYGGVISLDDQGRFDVLEFPPKFRRSDTEFIASQAMFDAGYTGVFHFHLHAQRYDNGRYSCPGTEDLFYADKTRANCLVFTFIDHDTINVDYYRYDRVIVDLGEIKRP